MPVNSSEDRTQREKANENLYRGYIYLMPHPEWTVAGELRFDIYDHESTFLTSIGDPKHVDTLSAPISVRYFHPLGFFAGLTGTPLYQEVRRNQEPNVFPRLVSGSDTSFLVDAAVGYRFPERFGLASLVVCNLFDTGFKYQDDSFRQVSEAPSVSRFIPERAILGYLTLNF